MVVGDVLVLRCIVCVPMSTIDGYWLFDGAPTYTRGRSGVLRTVFGVPTADRGRSGVLRAQPEVVQTHVLRN